jgi:hypothetical protein
MCNASWVCFDCRLTKRLPTWKNVTSFQPWAIGGIADGSVVCPKCHEPCVFLGPTVEVPPKLDVRGWKRLRKRVTELRNEFREMQSEGWVRWRHEIEQKIEALQNRPRNAGRDRLIKALRERLARGPGWGVRGRVKPIPSKL